VSKREEHARLTRLAIIEAAHRLFTTQGYAGTSIKAIAFEADASEQTVYRVFGDKAALLRDVVLAAVGGENNQQPLHDSPLITGLAALETPALRLEAVARLIRQGYDRGLAELENVVAAAAPTDERVAELARFMAEQRYEDTRSLVVTILGDTPLPPEFPVADIVDYVYATESSPVYTMLTSERGWTTGQYVEWFVRMFEQMFLTPHRALDDRPSAHRQGEGTT
jgi:AcrR family transcriptional regulator